MKILPVHPSAVELWIFFGRMELTTLLLDSALSLDQYPIYLHKCYLDARYLVLASNEDIWLVFRMMYVL